MKFRYLLRVRSESLHNIYVFFHQNPKQRALFGGYPRWQQRAASRFPYSWYLKSEER